MVGRKLQSRNGISWIMNNIVKWYITNWEQMKVNVMSRIVFCYFEHKLTSSPFSTASFEDVDTL